MNRTMPVTDLDLSIKCLPVLTACALVGLAAMELPAQAAGADHPQEAEPQLDRTQVAEPVIAQTTTISPPEQVALVQAEARQQASQFINAPAKIRQALAIAQPITPSAKTVPAISTVLVQPANTQPANAEPESTANAQPDSTPSASAQLAGTQPASSETQTMALPTVALPTTAIATAATINTEMVFDASATPASNAVQPATEQPAAVQPATVQTPAATPAIRSAIQPLPVPSAPRTRSAAQRKLTPPNVTPLLVGQSETNQNFSSGEMKLAQTTLSALTDVQTNWAQDFILTLASQDIVRGFPDRRYRPSEVLTRAQYAAMLQQALRKSDRLRRPNVREPMKFTDVPTTHWAYQAIQTAYQQGFMSGFAGNLFRPDQAIPRVQAIVSLTWGLKLKPTTVKPDNFGAYFDDAATVPEYAKDYVAAAIANRMVVNYPNPRQFNPTQPTTRAAAAAMIHQALVTAGDLPPLSDAATAAQYIVGPLTTAEAPVRP